MNITSFEINIWRIWIRNDSGDKYGFSPGAFNKIEFPGYNLAVIVSRKNEMINVGYKIYEEKSKVILQIADKIYEIKRIDGRLKPATMVLIDSTKNEIGFTELKQF